METHCFEEWCPKCMKVCILCEPNHYKYCAGVAKAVMHLTRNQENASSSDAASPSLISGIPSDGFPDMSEQYCDWSMSDIAKEKGHVSFEQVSRCCK